MASEIRNSGNQSADTCVARAYATVDLYRIIDRIATDTSVTPLLLTTPEAAKALRISGRTLWDLTKDGQIPSVRIKNRVLYDPQDLVEYIRRQKKVARLEQGR